MLIEEYRLHAELFGRERFLAFPVLIALLAGGGLSLFALTGTAVGTLAAGLHGLVFFFGLQVGTIGLVGRDALRDVLGDVTLLVFSARTLPVSRRRLLGVFIWKDIVYYLCFFLTPVVVGFVPVALTGGLTVPSLALLWLTVAGTFALGTGTSLALAGIATQNRGVLVAVVAALVAAVVLEPAVMVQFTPYGVFVDPGVRTAATGLLALAVVLVAGPLSFDPTSGRALRRTDPSRFRRLRSATDVHTARSLLEVTRSSGSVWKVGFSLGVLFGVALLLLDRLAAATTLDPSGGIAFGTLLGLGTFTTYNWVTQADDPAEYLRYPDGLQAVFRGKLLAFYACAAPFGAAYLAAGVLRYPAADLLVGIAVFPLVALYVFGVTAYLTGFSANELLFDTALFAVYGAALALVSVPLLVAALAHGTAPVTSTAVAVGVAAVAAAVGAVLAVRAPRRWHDRLRR
ncbi:hypothetical protein GRX03_13805 [Halovenus sp. WSH3]|uniref:ABC-2 type transport system permease protein n=2 Tax=Halovenus carboxidivorans TaxID=2692199 RepID=A0A6B0T3Q0_9EURY|nr:hypothetical protein [Halovenus carboxidivorans]MXR52675.1 hypothetical protein [Halovenus carboxidivorans]